MPINFSDLVSKVEQYNQMNRQQLVAQVMPAIDLAVQRRNVDYENEQFAQGVSEAAAMAGVNFTANPTDTKEITGLKYGVASNIKAAEAKKAEEAAKKLEAENSIRETIFAEAEVNSDFKPILDAVKDKPLVVQQAAYKKYLYEKGRADEYADWLKRTMTSKALGSSDGGTGEGKPTLTVNQVTNLQKDVDAAHSKIAEAANVGVMLSLGGKTYQVKAGKSSSGNIVASYGKYKYDGTNYTKGTPDEIKKLLPMAYGRAKTLQIDYDAAVRRRETAKGASTTQAQPKQQPASNNTVKSLVDRY